jgi:hypothetical protein
MRNTKLIIVLIIAVAVVSSCTQRSANNNSTTTTQTNTPVKQPIQEGLPTDLLEVIERQNEQLETVQNTSSGDAPNAIVSVSRKWPAGRKLTVAFNGGSAELRQKIIDAVKPWTAAANVTFDFGGDGATNLREWTVTDTSYKADIRIAFGRSPEGGYWSTIGKDSINPVTRRPNIASMNFEGFTEDLPDDWQATVLHEFGHALGFEHEHESPVSPCEQEYRWDDDPSYVASVDQYHQFVPDGSGRKPGIYTQLGGAPNYWSHSKVDFNLRKFAMSTDWFLTPFDRSSIMKYDFGPQMYKDLAVSTQSGCYGPPATGLSAGDQQAATTMYPRDPNSMKTLLNQQQVLVKKLLSQSDLPLALRDQLNTTLKIK